MDYFPPKSFIEWGCPRNSSTRVGSFTIEPINNQYNNEFYWCFSSYLDNGKFRTLARNGKFEITSPQFKTEEKAIRWLEKKFKEIVIEKIQLANNELNEKIIANNKFVNEILM